MKRFLVIGGNGQVGTALQYVPLPEDIVLISPNRSELDFARPESIEALIASGPWSGVINLAAYTAVDRAEDEMAAAWQANAEAPEHLALAAASRGIPIVHVSTDYVFSGELDRAYGETDAVGPLGVYGASKEAGERAVRSGNARHAIVRTSWVVSPYRSNFLKTMLRLADDRDQVRVVADQFGAPTSAKDLASFLLLVAMRLSNDPNSPTGTFHFSNRGEASWADVAGEIFRVSALHGGPTARVDRVSTADYPTRAMRPKNSRLNTTLIGQAFGIVPRPWQDAIHDIVFELVKGDRV
jgi:dTDP-4-dehydrorhamnose reductase